MEVKVVGPIKSKYAFEDEIKKLLEKNYKIIASNSFINKTTNRKWILIGYKTKIIHETYYYALLEKES